MQRTEVINAAGALTPANGDITVSVNAVTLGRVSAGYHTALGELYVGLAAALNDAVTTTNTVTPPAGITFTKPRTYAGGLAVVGGTLAAGSAQGIWLKLITKSGLTSSADLETLVSITGEV